LELQLASAVQRFNNLQRRAQNGRERSPLLTRALAELETALEELRVAHEQLIETRARLERIQGELRSEKERYWQMFDALPDAHVVSKADSTIVEANRVAAQLLNVSQRFLIGKSLSVFVCEDRARFIDAVNRIAADGGTLDLPIRLRPRERAPLTLSATVHGEGDLLRWRLKPSPDAPPTQ
jgi:PAS domain-containing protein